jgi:hypothetical protein
MVAAMIEVDFIVGFIVCVLSFIAGLSVGRDLGPIKRRDDYEPIEHAPPPPNVITFIRGRFVK